MQYSFKLHNLIATQELAKQIAICLPVGFIITLNAELGLGKTTLIRYILYSLGIQGSIKSPTYAIVESYKINNRDLYHFDLYRFNNSEEWFDSGLDEYFTLNSICFIEWAERALECIPHIDWDIIINIKNDIRVLEIKAKSRKGIQCLNQLITVVAK